MAHVILGGGITGLGAGYFLARAGKQVVVVEKRESGGGMAGSFVHRGFVCDVGPHKLYSVLPGVMALYKDLLGEECLTVEKKNSLRLCGSYFSFPVRPLQFAVRFPKITAARCGLSYAMTFLKPSSVPVTYEDYFLAGFGRAAYRLLFEGFCWKVWGNPREISAELARRRIPVPSIKEFIKNMVVSKQKPEVSADVFYYPRGGVGRVCDRLAEHVLKAGAVEYGSQPSRLVVRDGRVVEIEVRRAIGKSVIHDPETVTSTLYLQDLLSLFDPPPPENVLQAAERLRYRSLLLVYVFVNRPRVLDDHWIFFPEREFVFNRVSEQKNFSAHVAPADKTFLVAEISGDLNDFLWNMPEKQLADVAITDLVKAGLIASTDVDGTHIVRIDRMYPVYDLEYRKNLRIVLDWLHSIENFYTIGRQGLFAYTNTDHSLDMGQKLAVQILENKSRAEWEKTIDYFDSYRIVD
ncbi:FAD-dependent oxidoreductase [Candidatus Woesearchaeota archaeon]|nr:FAD-dependent oxidoreductase [Candidatus Woesearchaeota archaeon]